jgi:uncharacterized cysteine cluster protein YcgN (CxxCxxCC family)
MTDGPDRPFWQRKSLAEMTVDEWESLCDGCAKCCLIKLQDPGDGKTAYTDVACRLLDHNTCRCSQYAERRAEVPDCVALSADAIGALGWMPSTCGYRLIAEGRDLYWWHPLVSGDPETVHLAGISVRHRILSETEVDSDALEDRIVDWPR